MALPPRLRYARGSALGVGEAASLLDALSWACGPVGAALPDLAPLYWDDRNGPGAGRSGQMAGPAGAELDLVEMNSLVAVAPSTSHDEDDQIAPGR